MNTKEVSSVTSVSYGKEWNILDAIVALYAIIALVTWERGGRAKMDLGTFG